MGILLGALPVRVKTKSQTRIMTAASGDVEYTEYGFKPNASPKRFFILNPNAKCWIEVDEPNEVLFPSE